MQDVHLCMYTYIYAPSDDAWPGQKSPWYSCVESVVRYSAHYNSFANLNYSGR